MKTKIFFDTEFTGLHQKTTLISIGLVSETGKTFYAEFSDYDHEQIDDWLQDNVLSRLTNQGMLHNSFEEKEGNARCFGNTRAIKEYLKSWLLQFEEIEMWSDYLSYDWMLFCELFGGALNIPGHIYYIPFDICTIFKQQGRDPDISREQFSGADKSPGDVLKHNALWDAQLIMQCYKTLMENIWNREIKKA